MLQLAQRLRLDLADAFARHRELLADPGSSPGQAFFQRVVSVHAKTQPHAISGEKRLDHQSDDAGQYRACHPFQDEKISLDMGKAALISCQSLGRLARLVLRRARRDERVIDLRNHRGHCRKLL